MKQSGKAEVTVKIKRLYGFADSVTLTLSLPKGIKGVSIEGGKKEIAKGQIEIKTNITAAKTASAGDYTCQLRATVKYNNQTISIDRPIQVKVEAVKAAKK